VLLGLAVAAFALRPQIVGVGPILERIRDDLGMSHGAAGLLSTIPVLCMGIFAPPAAYLAARVGAARAVTVSLLLIAGFGLLRAGAPGASLLILLTIPIGIGMGMGNALMPVAVKERFAHNPLRATSVYTVGIQLGAAAAAALAVPLANLGSGSNGWRIPLAVFSIASLGCLVVWLLVQREGGGSGRPVRAAPVPRLPWRSTGAWWLCTIFLLITILFYGIGAWLPDVLVEDGWSESSAGATLAVLNATTVVATILVGTLGTRAASRRALMVPATALLVIGTLGIATYTDGAWLWAMVCGAGIGTLFPTMMTLPIDVADRAEAVGAVAGLMLLVGYVGAAPTPSLLGALRDWTGTYSATTWALFGVAVTALAVASMLTHERMARGVP
jgi:MFS transporter, CP family, cyanate transporter